MAHNKKVNLDCSLSHHQHQQLSILGRRISPISYSCLWCSTRPGRTSACRGSYRSCARQPFQTCAREESDPTSSGTFYQTLSDRPHPCSFLRCPCNSLVITESHASGDVINIWLFQRPKLYFCRIPPMSHFGTSQASHLVFVSVV